MRPLTFLSDSTREVIDVLEEIVNFHALIQHVFCSVECLVKIVIKIECLVLSHTQKKLTIKVLGKCTNEGEMEKNPLIKTSLSAYSVSLRGHPVCRNWFPSTAG